MTIEPFYQDDCLELSDLWVHADVMVLDIPPAPDDSPSQEVALWEASND